ncbi:MAG: hypothetical protein Q7U38_09850 [Methylobacter sp.]|nr:hypothetical protein [Methylobacter sp.]MDP2098744.1 hypothetical protein [Methylobacter sp.]MDP2426523.1 hypothetical protein [Methylobacter sp.]MDP3056210.1 hypothetical protein [Methylobacter sp.]MDP3361494.1 hypothetical protein [Methylobacter sp.]
MSARTLSDQTLSLQERADDRQLAVSFRLLLGLYSIIPLCLLLQLFDVWFWQGALQQSLPSSPRQFLLFQILFGTPHIIASSILLASNAEYLKMYRLKIILMTAAIILIFGVGSLFISYRALYVAVAAWTVYHVLKQQLGVGRGVYRLPDWAFCLLLWLSVTAGFFVYIGIFLKNSLEVQQLEWIKLIAGGLCAALICSALLCQRYATTAVGKWFLWSNVLLVLSSFYLFVQQYYFLAILVPRLVHDATAYIFYVVHDYNKHRLQPQNVIYHYAARCRLPIFVVLPVSSFLLAFALQSYGDSAFNAAADFLFGVEINKAISVGLLGYLALMHYYTEAFTWKQGSPYRRFIAFSK